jgi:hypothetical protein
MNGRIKNHDQGEGNVKAAPVPDDPAVRLRAAVAGERFFAQRQSRKDRDMPAFWTDWARVSLTELGLAPDSIPALRRDVGRLRKSQWVDPAAIPLLKALREKGYRIGLVSRRRPPNPAGHRWPQPSLCLGTSGPNGSSFCHHPGWLGGKTTTPSRFIFAYGSGV